MIGCHGLVWTGDFGPAGFEHAVTKSRATGYEILELPLLDPYSFDAGAAAEVLRRDPITITASLGQSRETDITSEDLDRVRAGEAKLNKALDVLGALGSEYLVGVLFGELRKYSEPPTARARANGVAVIRNIADKAAELGITLGLEVVNRYESNMINTATQALRYIDEVDRGNVKVHLDTYHMNIEESDMYRPVALCGDRLGYVHVGESHRGYLGSGTVDFPGFFRALDTISYDGPIVFETFSTAIVNEDLSRMLAVWRDLWDDSDDLARHALDFVRTGLRAVQAAALH